MDYPANLKVGLYSLFLYTDLIQFQAVGDSFTPLLGVIDVKGSFGEIVVHYLPLSRSYIKENSIDVKTDLNASVDFNFGKVDCETPL